MITTFNMNKCGLYQCPQLSDQHLVKGHQKQMSKLEINKRMQIFFLSVVMTWGALEASKLRFSLLLSLSLLPSIFKVGFAIRPCFKFV